MGTEASLLLDVEASSLLAGTESRLVDVEQTCLFDLVRLVLVMARDGQGKGNPRFFVPENSSVTFHAKLCFHGISIQSVRAIFVLWTI